MAVYKICTDTFVALAGCKEIWNFKIADIHEYFRSSIMQRYNKKSVIHCYKIR